MFSSRQSAVVFALVFLYCLATVIVCSPLLPPALAEASGTDGPDAQDHRPPAVRDAIAARTTAIHRVYVEAPKPSPGLDSLTPPQPISTAQNSQVHVETSLYRPCPNIECYRLDITRAFAEGWVQEDVETLVFDLATGRILGLADVLQLSEAALGTVSELVYAQLTQSLSSEDTAGFERARRAAYPCSGNFARFILTEDAIVFYFPPAILGAGAAIETREARIPYLDLVAFLNITVGYSQAGIPESCIHIRAVADGEACDETDGRPRIALTFDDGPHPVHTPLILQELSRRGAVATFCVVGARAKANPDLIRQIALQGSEIGNHTWTHSDLTRLGTEQILAEIARTQQLVADLTGRRPTFMRPPGGTINRQVIGAVGLPVVMWSIDPQDWRGADAASVAAYIIGRAHDGGIVLQHDSRVSSYESLGQILDELSAQGYRFVTVSSLLGLSGPESVSPESGLWYRLKPG